MKDGTAMADEMKFHEGDRVFYPYYGLGTVIANCDDGSPYPVHVKWDHSPVEWDVSTFTKEGRVAVPIIENEYDVNLILIKDMPPEEKGAEDEKKEEQQDEKMRQNLEVIDLSEEAKGKDNSKKGNAINPKHYKVKGIPEAYDIMTHLMTREQLEGFFWGNIIKYAYRYGRKGDEAETAGKIA